MGILTLSSNERLSPDELDALCTDTCHNSLTTVRQTIIDGCNGPTNIIKYFDGVDYPGTLDTRPIFLAFFQV